jgi:hypothetical protein
VDALELQLRRQLDQNHGGTTRNTDLARIPAGYQDSVAEYYRKLSSAATSYGSPRGIGWCERVGTDRNKR